MNKYRIHKQVQYIDKEEYNTYRVQYKFLFWWFNCKFDVVFSLCTKSKSYGPCEVALITKRKYTFNSEPEARKFLEEKQNAFYLNYKRNKIYKIFCEITSKGVTISKYIYVNKSYSTDYCGLKSYEYNFDLNKLKEQIDERQPKATKYDKTISTYKKVSTF